MIILTKVAQESFTLISLTERRQFSNTISSLRMVWQCIVATAFAMKLSKQAKRAGEVSAFRQSTLASTSLHREHRLYQAEQLDQDITTQGTQIISSRTTWPGHHFPGNIDFIKQNNLAGTSLHREHRLYQAEQLGQEINAERTLCTYVRQSTLDRISLLREHERISSSQLGQEINTQGTQKDELRQSTWPGNRSSKNTFKVVYLSQTSPEKTKQIQGSAYTYSGHH